MGLKESAFATIAACQHIDIFFSPLATAIVKKKNFFDADRDLNFFS